MHRYPAVPHAFRAEARSPERAAPGRTARGRILLCDDSPTELSILTALLQRAGHGDVTAVRDPREVMPLLGSGGFDLLVLDIEMPHLGGMELMKLVRTRWSEAELPIVAISGWPSRHLRTAALSQGANEVLDKPLDFAEASLRISKLLAMREVCRRHEDTHRALESQVAARNAKLDLLIETGLMIAAERDRSRLLRHILFEGQRLLNCDGGTMYLSTPHKTLRFALRTKDDELPSTEIPLYGAEGRANLGYVCAWVAHHQESVRIDDVYSETRFDLSGTRRFDAESQYRTVSMLTVPLAPRDGEVIGVLQYMNAKDAETGEIVPFSPDLVSLVEAFAAQAAVALDNVDLVESQQALMESMIRVMATAIDAKSPYTGAHCERVPEIAMALAREACRSTQGSLAAFEFSTEAQWQEFRIGAWLHDVGKVTTPEYVIDKATKLETIYSRIHEVRTRFEVLHRDSEIERLQALLAGMPPGEAQRAHEERVRTLQDDFAFVAQCNVGGETLEAAHVERLEAIGRTTWLRHFDDRLGLSQDELRRREGQPAEPLPAREPLLADKPHHLVPRTHQQQPDPSFGFAMKVPEHLYNHGELYNLKVPRGTLTEEERFKINEHMIHTVVMLERMAFPKSLQRVPEYAGTHHETLLGTGYPRRLSAGQLSVPSRIMAIADVFEALTAADRPYKPAKKLSEALGILHAMAFRQHLDAELFNLFLTSGVYLDYASRHLCAEQIDRVDIEALLIDLASLPPLAPPPQEARP